MNTVTVSLEIDGDNVRVELSSGNDGGEWIASVDGEAVPVDARLIGPGILSLIVEGNAYRCVLDESPVETATQIGGRRYVYAIDDPRSLASRRRKTGASTGAQIIKAPMPGRIVRLLADVGDEVEAHQGVVVIEAMKMQNELKAARAGKILEVRTEAGATVAAGAILMLIE